MLREDVEAQKMFMEELKKLDVTPIFSDIAFLDTYYTKQEDKILELELELEKENFKRYANKDGYEITVDTSSKDYTFYRVFVKEDAVFVKYMPQIHIENEDGKYIFYVINNIHINSREVEEMLVELEKYKIGYTLAKSVIEQFKAAIQNGVI